MKHPAPDEVIYPEKTYIGLPPHRVLHSMGSDGETKDFPLAPSLKLRNHSPTGFSWGYGGSGPTQLAIALLLDATLDPDTAQDYAWDFKSDFVARWPSGERWIIRRLEILEWLEKTKAEYLALQQSRN